MVRWIKKGLIFKPTTWMDDHTRSTACSGNIGDYLYRNIGLAIKGGD